MKRLGWIFETAEGKTVVAQLPNLPLGLFIVFWVLYWLLRDQYYGAVFMLLAQTAILVWAGMELARGVNIFRKILGGSVLLYMLLTLQI